MNLPNNNNIGFVIHDAARLLTRRFQIQAQRYEITLPQWRVIAQLAQTDGLSQTALARIIDTDQMTACFTNSRTRFSVIRGQRFQ
jgi:MarR family transcriptional regulator for hemolysin